MKAIPLIEASGSRFCTPGVGFSPRGAWKEDEVGDAGEWAIAER